jgi:hypothetical protein
MSHRRLVPLATCDCLAAVSLTPLTFFTNESRWYCSKARTVSRSSSANRGGFLSPTHRFYEFPASLEHLHIRQWVASSAGMLDARFGTRFACRTSRDVDNHSVSPPGLTDRSRPLAGASSGGSGPGQVCPWPSRSGQSGSPTGGQSVWSLKDERNQHLGRSPVLRVAVGNRSHR